MSADTVLPQLALLQIQITGVKRALADVPNSITMADAPIFINVPAEVEWDDDLLGPETYQETATYRMLLFVAQRGSGGGRLLWRWRQLRPLPPVGRPGPRSAASPVNPGRGRAAGAGGRPYVNRTAMTMHLDLFHVSCCCCAVAPAAPPRPLLGHAWSQTWMRSPLAYSAV